MRRGAWTHTAIISLFGACALAIGGQPPATTPDIRAFRPSANGFAFVNHFEGSPSPINLGGLDRSLGAPTTFGLCGGMSFAACDLFMAGRTPPARPSQPAKGETLYDYIQTRQIKSLGEGLNLAGRFGRWMSAPDDGGFGTRTLSVAELEDITAALAKGQPVVLGLVFNHHAANKDARGPAGPPWQNHQVLAYDAAPIGGDANTIDIRIYDPNYPKADDVVIRCRTVITGWMTVGPWGGVQAPVLGVACERRVGRRQPTLVRGIFAMPYAAALPPRSLD